MYQIIQGRIARPGNESCSGFFHGRSMINATEFEIPVDLYENDNVYEGIITMLLDGDGNETWRPWRAVVAVGIYLTGPLAGQPFVTDDIDTDNLKEFVQ